MAPHPRRQHAPTVARARAVACDESPGRGGSVQLYRLPSLAVISSYRMGADDGEGRGPLDAGQGGSGVRGQGGEEMGVGRNEVVVPFHVMSSHVVRWVLWVAAIRWRARWRGGGGAVARWRGGALARWRVGGGRGRARNRQKISL